MLALLLLINLGVHADDRLAPLDRPDIQAVRTRLASCQRNAAQARNEVTYTRCAEVAARDLHALMSKIFDERLAHLTLEEAFPYRRGQMAWVLYRQRYTDVPSDAPLRVRQRAFSWDFTESLNRILWISHLGAEPFSPVIDVAGVEAALETCLNNRTSPSVCEDGLRRDVDQRFEAYLNEGLTKVTPARAEQMRKGQWWWEEYRRVFCQPATGDGFMSPGGPVEPTSAEEYRARAQCWLRETAGRFEWVDDSTIVTE